MSSHHVDPRELIKTVVLENEEKEEELQTTLEHLDRNFSVLMVAVRSSLDHKLQHQQLVLVDFIRWIEHRMKWVGQLSNIIDLDEIFLKLHPYFDFLDCGLIVDMSEQFLNDECFAKKGFVSELKEHKIKANTLRSSSTIKKLQTHLKSIYSPYLRDLSNMPQIQIELHNPWSEASIEGLYLLIRHLLPHRSKQSILKYIEITTGSVHIKYIVHESNADCLIAYAQSKLQLMRLIGIFGLTINGEPVLEEDENMNFTFESALFKAAKAGHNEAIQFLFTLGGDVDYFNEEGITALMIASKGGYEQIVLSLVSAGANVNIQDNEGWTTLMIASENGHTQVVKQLLKENTDVNIQDNDGWTALMIASENGHTQIVEQLLKVHADVNIKTNEGWTALMIASQNGHTHIIEQLIKENADVNIQNNDGWTALMICSQNGYTQVVEQLLKEHADVNNLKKNGWTALMIASYYGHTEVIEQLLKEHANVNIQTNHGWTALMIASQNGHTQVIEQLLNEHTDVNIRNNNGITALMITSANGHTQVVELLTKELVDIDVQMKDGSTALMIACYNGHLQIAVCLLQSFADPHIIAHNGSTAFSLAAFSGNRDLVNMLLDKAEPTTDEIEKAVVTSCYGGHPTLITFLSNKLPHLNNDQRELLDSCVKGDLGAVIMKTLDSPDTPLVLGLTPLMIASSCGHVDIVDALIQTGADVNKQESHLGLTPLSFAVNSSKSSSIIETLLMYGAHPNIIADNYTPLDVANEETIKELLISCGGQTISQLQGKKKYESFDPRSLLPTLCKEATTKSLLEINDITMYKESSYTLERKRKVKSFEVQNFISLMNSFT